MKKFIINIEVELEVPEESRINEDEIADGYRNAFERGVLFDRRICNVKESINRVRIEAEPSIKEKNIETIVDNIQSQVQFLAEMFNLK